VTVLEDEMIVFADKDLKEGPLCRLRAAGVQVGNSTSQSVGTAMRIIAKGESRSLFDVAFKWRETNKSNGALVTSRAPSGLTVELKDSTLKSGKS
jgi:hypothetical protein